MKNKGFTLAEVLITLGIIGVVAALTTPALLHNVGTAEIGPKLAKFRSTVENANKMMLVENDVNRLPVLIRRGGNGNETQTYTGLLQNFMRLDSGDAITSGIKAYTGDTDLGQINVTTAAGQSQQVTLNNANSFTFRTVEGMAAHFEIQQNPANIGNIGVALVDINGTGNPNRLGKDIFGFVLDANGMLTPIGSTSISNALPEDIPDDYDYNQVDWQNSCNAEEVRGNGLTCTGSIFANDLKVVYD